MTTAEDVTEPAPRKRKGPVMVAVLALAVAGAGFGLAYTGLLHGAGGSDEHDPVDAAPLPDIAFVPVDPMIVSLGSGDTSRHLRFTAQLEVESAYQKDVAALMPRVLDVLNGYLRAIDPAEFEDSAALFRLRAQMLRRVQIVTGEGRVRDLLVTEFVLN